MLIPKKMPKPLSYVVYPLLCALHGLAFGVLYAPAQALILGYTFEETLAWIAYGLTIDIVHMVGNLFAGLLIVPTADLLRKLSKGRLDIN